MLVKERKVIISPSSGVEEDACFVTRFENVSVYRVRTKWENDLLAKIG